MGSERLKAVEGTAKCCECRMVKSVRIRLAGHVARVGQEHNACRTLFGIPEGPKTYYRPKRRWKDNVRIYVKGTV